MKLINPRIFYYLRQFKKRFLLLALGLLLFEGFKLIPSYVFGLIIDSLVKLSNNTFPLVLQLCGIFFVASVISHILEKIFDRYYVILLIKIHTHLLASAASKLLSLSMGYHEERQAGAGVSRIHRGIDKIMDLGFQVYSQFIPTILQLVLTFITLTFIHWPSGLVFGASIPFFIWYSVHTALRLQPLRVGYHKIEEQAAGHLTQGIMNVRTVQDFAKEDDERTQHQNLLGEFRKGWLIRHDFEANRDLIRDLCLAVVRVGTMLFYVYMVIIGQITPGILVFFVTLTEKSFLALFRIGKIFSWAGDSIEGMNLLVEVLDEKETVEDKQNAISLDQVAGKLELKDVTFSYSRSKEILKNISLEIKSGSTVAIVGRSGSGKSTIVKLFFRHFDVTKGAILIDGHDVRDVTKKSLRDHLAIVAQDVEIFNTTVLENIRYSKPSATLEEVQEAARIANAHDFILSFPNGYETLVGEKGVKLSGGQKQRVGIARAILKKPAILVFDEATSSLDSESEKLIQQSMWQIAKNCTMIIIAHRLSTIEHADQIVVLDEGRIVESGTHTELLEKKGLFARMQELQYIGQIRE